MSIPEGKVEGVLVDTLAKIDRYGWTIIGVFNPVGSDEVIVPFAYTVGLSRKGLPELVMSYPDSRAAQSVLNAAAQRALATGAFTPGVDVTDILVGYPVRFASCGTERLSVARALYGNDEVSAMQLVWPDKDRRFPWDEGYSLSPEVQEVIE